jgi:hypothetical protein
MKFSSIQFSSADVIKLVGGVIAIGGFYLGLTSKIDAMNAKLDKVIAIQNGVDNVQNLRIENVEKDLSRRERTVFHSQPAMKPKPVGVEEED